jgi:hypothetical protein
MDESSQKLKDAAYGRLLPSVIDRRLKPLDTLATIPILSLILQILLALLYRFITFASTVISRMWGLYHAFHATLMFVLTFWRIGFPVPHYPGPRVHEREFSVSNAFGMKDVKTIQRAFSKRNGSGGEMGRNHLTVNDILVAIMADVLDAEVRAAEAKNRHSVVRRLADRLLPSTVSFFMCVYFRPH